jgi:enamine deaminase RidA (YjgF/YER057c/UK114 family)
MSSVKSSSDREYLKPEGVRPPDQPYSNVVRVGKTVYLAGQVPVDKDGNVVGPGDPTRQAEQCWKNIELCLAAAGATLNDIVKVVAFFSDIRHVKYEVEVRKRILSPDHYPAFSLMEAAKVGSTKDNILMEIDVTAVLP